MTHELRFYPVETPDKGVQPATIQEPPKPLTSARFFILPPPPSIPLGLGAYRPQATTTAHIEVKEDGKILMDETFNFSRSTGCHALARLNLNRDGTLDESFCPGARIEPGLCRDCDMIDALAVQTNGRLMMGGSFGAPADAAGTGYRRLNADVIRDESFVCTRNTRAFGGGIHILDRSISAPNEPGADLWLVRGPAGFESWLAGSFFQQ